MSRVSIFFIWGVAAFFLAIFHTLALELYLYWLLPWSDNLAHGLGGAVVFVPIFLYVREHYGIGASFLCALLGLLVVDVAWETFQLLSGLTAGKPDWLEDTLMDTGASIVGAVAFLPLILWPHKKKQHDEQH